MNENDFCVKYLEDKMIISFKVIGAILILIIMLFTLKNSILKNDLVGIFAVVIGLYINLKMILYQQIHRFISYDEICVKDEYFIVKKDNKIKSKTLLNDIYGSKHISIFQMTDNGYIKLRDKDNNLLFHYRQSELSQENHQKIMKLFCNKIKEIH